MAFITHTTAAGAEVPTETPRKNQKTPSFLGWRIFLLLLSTLALGQGLSIMIMATTVMQQIEGYLAFVVAAILFAAAVIVDVLRAVLARLDR